MRKIQVVTAIISNGTKASTVRVTVADPDVRAAIDAAISGIRKHDKAGHVVELCKQIGRSGVLEGTAVAGSGVGSGSGYASIEVIRDVDLLE